MRHVAQRGGGGLEPGGGRAQRVGGDGEVAHEAVAQLLPGLPAVLLLRRGVPDVAGRRRRRRGLGRGWGAADRAGRRRHVWVRNTGRSCVVLTSA